MSVEAAKFLDKAARSIPASHVLLASGDVDFAAAQAYYAMFYTAGALLAARGVRFSKHAGVHAAFDEHFVKTRVLHPVYHRWLLDAFDKRIEADYGIEVTFAAQEIEEMLRKAEEFLRGARQYLEAQA